MRWLVVILSMIISVGTASAQQQHHGPLPDMPLSAEQLRRELGRGFGQFSPIPHLDETQRFTPRRVQNVRPPPDLDWREAAEIAREAQGCLGEYQCMHAKLHAYYRYAFYALQCSCHTGYCRPSKVREVDISPTNETGLQVWANGQWCDVTKDSLRRDGKRIPATLLQVGDHVCIGNKGCEQLECTITGAKS